MPQANLIPPSNIPDLSSLHAQAEWLGLNRALTGGGAADHIAYTLQLNCVRLSDAAIRDYSFGRQAILAFHANSNHVGIGYVAAASTHFENCVWHLERFIKHARALRSAKSAETSLKTLIPRDLSFFQPSVEHRITQIRHTLAHLERDALKGDLPQGSNIILMPLEAGLSISSHLIGWQELSGWLQDAHACSSSLARHKP